MVGLQLLLSPYLAAGLPAAGAAAIVLYGSYGEDLRYLYNSLFRKCVDRYNSFALIIDFNE